MGPIKIILIVAECNVNFAFAGMHKIQSYILIVAECNVNYEKIIIDSTYELNFNSSRV